MGTKTVKVRYPSFGEWNHFFWRVALVFKKLSLALDDLEMPESVSGLLKQSHFPAWAAMMFHLFQHKMVSKDIEDIFFKYLRPELHGIFGDTPVIVDDPKTWWDRIWHKRRLKKANKAREWIINNAPIDAVVRMFAALLVPEAMIKKNVIYLMEVIFQDSIESGSTITSPVNPPPPTRKNTSMPLPAFA